MQLKPEAPPADGRLRRMLASAAAGLLAGVQAHAQDSSGGPSADAATTTIDAVLLYYHESGRVRAIEPDLDLTHKIGEDSVLSLGLTVDAVTGATPLGAVPSTLLQTYVRPYKVIPVGTPVTVTTASGGAVVVLIPPPTGATTKTLQAQITVAPNTYPLQGGFSDERVAGHAGWEQSLTSTLKLDGGAAYSKERDYRSWSANLGLSKDLYSHNTTLSAGANYESDLSFPIGGTPTPLTVMSGDWKGPDATRRELDAVVGVTQVMTRRWLTTLSYSYARASGYQNDPYKIISVVDPVSGEPTTQRYESRPDTRRKQSIYWDNKIHLDRDIVEAGLRGYEDDWGIHSVTADLKYRLERSAGYYLEPHLRYYSQGAANVFHYYLVDGQPLPQYASADARLAQFQATTYGLKLGVPWDEDGEGGELSVRIEYYHQQGNGSPSHAIGQLRQQNLYPALNVFTVLFGYNYRF
jgi:hypothetical protein